MLSKDGGRIEGEGARGDSVQIPHSKIPMNGFSCLCSEYHYGLVCFSIFCEKEDSREPSVFLPPAPGDDNGYALSNIHRQDIVDKQPKTH